MKIIYFEFFKKRIPGNFFANQSNLIHCYQTDEWEADLIIYNTYIYVSFLI